jgi:hypothetical protein
MPETISAEQVQDVQISEKTIDQSQPFIGLWNKLISTTNWDKGDVICKWRKSLEDAKAAAAEFSDEAWSQMVAGVTPQHVGRLRRTFDRFGHVYSEYDGVYWSHFYAALDWDDAEMWLEGAVQNKWSVSKMRQHRWETLGKKPGEEPDPQDIVSTEISEETQSLELAEGKRQNDRDYIEGPVHEGPDFGDEDQAGKGAQSKSEFADKADSEPSAATVRPFESFTDLPEDIMEVTSELKVAIIRHRSEEWSEISKEDMLSLLDAFKQLVNAPAE